VRRPGLLAWLGVFLPPAAWIGQHIFGWGSGVAACPDNRSGGGLSVPVDTITIVLGGAAVALIVLGGAASLTAWLATREDEDDDAPPAGRIHFLSVIGLTICPLFLAIVLMSSAGAIVANGCTQS
jgi:hypothetical protein